VIIEKVIDRFSKELICNRESLIATVLLGTNGNCRTIWREICQKYLLKVVLDTGVTELILRKEIFEELRLLEQTKAALTKIFVLIFNCIG
jgi:hypothetical protein